MTDTSRLPGPNAELWEWQFQGSCRRFGDEPFFHPEGERGPSRRSRDAAAKAICRRCPVAKLCRDHALRAREPYGVWGGMTEDERTAYYAGRESGVPENAMTLAIG